MILAKFSVAAASLLAAMGFASSASAQGVEVSAAQLSSVEVACVDPNSVMCADAIGAVLAAFPGVPASVVLGSMAAQYATLSNSAIAGGSTGGSSTLSTALSGIAVYASGLGLDSLSTVIVVIASAVAAGEQVDVTAIASGSGDSAPDAAASPT